MDAGGEIDGDEDGEESGQDGEGDAEEFPPTVPMPLLPLPPLRPLKPIPPRSVFCFPQVAGLASVRGALKTSLRLLPQPSLHQRP